MRRTFQVQKAINLGYGGHTRCPTPTMYKSHEPGTILRLYGEAPNGNVWFIDPDGGRGVIPCGEVRNLTRDGRVVEM